MRACEGERKEMFRLEEIFCQSLNTLHSELRVIFLRGSVGLRIGEVEAKRGLKLRLGG